MNKLAAHRNRRRHVSLRGGEAERWYHQHRLTTSPAPTRKQFRCHDTSPCTVRKKKEGEPTAMTLFVTENNMEQQVATTHCADENTTNSWIAFTIRAPTSRVRTDTRQPVRFRCRAVLFFTFFQSCVRQVTARTMLNMLVASMMKPADITEKIRRIFDVNIACGTVLSASSAPSTNTQELWCNGVSQPRSVKMPMTKWRSCFNRRNCDSKTTTPGHVHNGFVRQVFQSFAEPAA